MRFASVPTPFPPVLRRSARPLLRRSSSVIPIAAVLVFLGLALMPRVAGAVDVSSQVRMPDDLEQVDFLLHTVDVGIHYYEAYGHTQIRVRDRAAGTDLVYTWGIFDPDAKGYALRTYNAIQNYSIGVVSTQQVLSSYQREGRQVWEDRLELTTAQKRRLMEGILQQMKAENREFPYRYFFDNCSTRPRDIVDQALSGAVRQRSGNGPGEFRFRDMVRRHQAVTPFFSLALEVVMNSQLERTMTRWEESFVPVRLRDLFLEMPQFDDEGVPVDGTCLLTPVRTYQDKPTPELDYRRDDRIAYAALGLVSCVTLLVGAVRRARNDRRPLPKLLVRAYGLSLALWGTVAFGLSLLMIADWLFCHNADLWHSANLWLLWPVDAVFVPAGGGLLRHGTAPTKRCRLAAAARFVAAAHLVAGAICVALWWLGIIEQDLSRTLAVFGVCGLLNYVPLLGLTAPASAARPEGSVTDSDRPS